MAQILVVYSEQPLFPPTDQQAGAQRVQLSGMWVDSIGGVATQADLDAFNASNVVGPARHAAFIADPVRGDVVTHLKNDDLAQIEAYVRGKINASAVTDLASAKLCMQRIENALAGLTQAVALVVRE